VLITINNNNSENSAVIISDGHIKTVHVESIKNGIVNVTKELSNVWRDILLKTICRGALNENSEPILCVSLPLVYKALFGVELNQQQKLDLGIVIRDAIPAVKTRPKVLTIHSETKTPIWILHYKLEELSKIVDMMLSMNGYQ
jgi:hypothetical protein